MQGQRVRAASAQVEQVHPLVDELAAPRDARSARHSVVAEPATVAVAGADVQDLAEPARPRLGDRARDAPDGNDG